MKNVKIHTKLVISFIIVDVLVLIVLLLGYSTVMNISQMENAEHYLNSYKLFSGIEFIILVALLSYISVSVTKEIRKSTEKIIFVAREMADGKVDVEIGEYNNNEFGEILDECEKLLKSIRYQAEIAEDVADGNLTVEVKPKSEQDVMGNSLQKLVTRNAHALSNISDAAFQVMTSSSQVASASEALAQGSMEQASAIEQITASISDIAGKTKQNASEANNAAELVAKAIEDVKRGNTQMRDMMGAMQDINQSSESISKIIKVIDDIAFQTNILALNAAVEAARAGDAGKGFAVVAEEVRNLAAKSAAAASETAELIEDSIHKVESGSQIADDTAKALEAITEVVKESEAIITGIAEASNYQATAIAQIDQAVEQVSQVVQTNSATSEECAAASVELSNQANRMRDLLSVYNLGNHTITAMSNYAADDHNNTVETDNEQIISLGGGFGKY